MPEATYGWIRKKEKGLLFMFLCRWFIYSTFIALSTGLIGQNLKCRTISTNQLLLLDSGVIEPGSIQVEGRYNYSEQTKKVIVKNESSDSIKICYRVLSTYLTEPLINRSISQYEATFNTDDIKKNLPAELSKDELFDFKKINKYGAIRRGLTFGNRQNLFVNSSLNLQMDGELDDNLFLTASITDQNIPYQPEGNTQQIRDFDNVFIKVYNDQFDLTAGDIVLKEPIEDGYFLKYYKNIQGLQGRLKGNAGNGWNFESGVSGALSKGKFYSTTIDPIDGLNGPYKLRGPNGERFIVILANSEKVFLEGKQLARGFDQDYTIDYNLGEIKFNNHLVITQFSIIKVDYEYAEQFYNRSNFSGYTAFFKNNIKLYANFYQERDNPNTNLGFTLNDSDLDHLISIGDKQDQSFVTGLDSVQFNENQVLYARKDTLDLDGKIQRIFVNSNDPRATLFSPTFSEVGFGNGNYSLLTTTANGKIYQWVSPINDQLQGSFEPGAFIPLPNKRRLITMGGKVGISPYETIQLETSFSDRDNNLYSALDDENNTGQAVFLSLASVDRPSFISGYKWSNKIRFEYNQKDYTFIDRYRPILFERDWSFNQEGIENGEDMIFFANLGLVKDERDRVEFSINRRKRTKQMDGWQQSLNFNQTFRDFQFNSTHFHLANKRPTSKTYWIKSRSDLSYNRWRVVPGINYELDQNTTSVRDSIVSTLMNFDAIELYVTNSDSSISTFRFGYKVRQDRLPQFGELKDYLFSKNLTGHYAIKGKKGHISLDMNYRKVEDKLGIDESQEEIINGRINWSQQFFDQILTHKFSYATGNSRELKRSFIYLPVNTGEGTHTWRDNNGDGVQDLNEFFEALNSDERNYALIFTPTDDYIIAFQTIYLHTLDIRPPLTWKNQGAIKKFLSKIALNANFNVNYKTTSASYEDRLNPFGINLSDESLIAANEHRRYTLFFNRNGRGFGADFTRQTSDNKQLLTQGFETRKKEEWLTNFKVNLSSEYIFRMSSGFGSQTNESDYLVSRNFDIVFNNLKPQLIWQPTSKLRMIGSFEKKSKHNRFSEHSNESAMVKAYSGELIWNKAATGSLRGTVSFISIDFTGDPATYLGYLLLDGLQPGSNQTWQISWQQRLFKGMQLSLVYNGRKSADLKAIHTGSLEVTAFF